MKAYFFSEYRDKAGIGSYKVFATEDGAIIYCKGEWDFMSDADKESYLTDSVGSFCVYLAEVLTDEDGARYPGECEAVIYDALEEHRKAEADRIAGEWGEEVSFSAAVALMDDEIREAIHADGYDNPQAFYDEYCTRHADKYGEAFTI